MSAIYALLRIMSLRGADALVLASGQPPALRRAERLEPLTLASLEESELASFVTMLAAPGDEPRSSVAFTSPEGKHYDIAVDRTGAGLQLVARPRTSPPPRPLRPATTTQPPTAPPAPSSPTRIPVALDQVAPQGDAAPPHTLPAPISDEALAELRVQLAPLVAAAVASGASDLFLSDQGHLRLRVRGQLRTCDEVPAPPSLASTLAALLEGHTHVDLGLQVGASRVRLHGFRHHNGVSAALRVIRDEVPSLRDLGLPTALGEVAKLREGLVLICGPTGSGKTTTLAALIRLLDAQRGGHIVTLEAPIEYAHPAQRGLIHQREIPTHVASFHEGLRAALRQAPDIIVLGELRDAATMATALRAAETGHLVLATLHAPHAAGAVARLVDALPESNPRLARTQLANVLRSITTQALLPGRHGRLVLAYEHVPFSPALANIVRQGELHTFGNALLAQREQGTSLFEERLAALVAGGELSPELAHATARDPELLASLLARRR